MTQTKVNNQNIEVRALAEAELEAVSGGVAPIVIVLVGVYLGLCMGAGVDGYRAGRASR